jgi:outer membrane lipoprotein LolB
LIDTATLRTQAKAFAACTLAGVLVGCAPAALERADSTAPVPPVQEAFDVSGRLSARHGSDAVAANFQWRHANETDELELVSPLGQTIAVLTGDATSARLRTSDGRVLDARSWTTLTQEGLGWTLPVEGLKFWLQGAPRSDAAFTTETGGDGRIAVLRQDGWTIVYQSYVQVSADVWRPSRMTASYPGIELRLAVDRWQ